MAERLKSLENVKSKLVMLFPRLVSRWVGGIVLGLSLLLTGGCPGVLTPPSNGGGSGSLPSTVSGEVRIIFVNTLTREAVEVQFHATNQPLSSIPGDLFVEGSEITESIGVAGTGLLPPGLEDTITFPCTQTLTLGTMGGLFSDIESGEARGAGDMRWVQDQGLGLCGRIVTLTFSGDGQVFTTQISVQ